MERKKQAPQPERCPLLESGGQEGGRSQEEVVVSSLWSSGRVRNEEIFCPTGLTVTSNTQLISAA